MYISCAVWKYMDSKGNIVAGNLLATMFLRYFASKFVAKLPAVVTFG